MGWLKVNASNPSPNLGEAATRFLTSLAVEKREASQQEIHRFVRWYGRERPFAGLAPPEVASYAERLSSSDTDHIKKLELIRAFLGYARKEGWSRTNLAIHLKPKKGKTRPQPLLRQGQPEATSLTRQGYAELEAELAALKDKRPGAIEEMHRAAADKDFRENAPLDAARAQRGLLEGRIEELEEILKSATIIDEKQELTVKADIGDSIILRDLDAGEEQDYMIVSPREADPTRGKISSASPLGKAVIGRGEGEVVEVAAPAGKLCFQIRQVKH